MKRGREGRGKMVNKGRGEEEEEGCSGSWNHWLYSSQKK